MPQSQNTQTADQAAGMEGSLAIPRSNGTPVFNAPWEGRAFGIAVALNENGMYEWGEFQRRLADEIAAAERTTDTADTYYERWLASLERLLLDCGALTANELDLRTAAYASGELDD